MSIKTINLGMFGPDTSTLGAGFDASGKKIGDTFEGGTIITMVPVLRICNSRSIELCKVCVDAEYAKKRNCEIPLLEES